jgi:hypothetical protein
MVNNKKERSINIIKITPWIPPTQTMSNSCYKLTMDMIDKQPPKRLPIYEKIDIYKESSNLKGKYYLK